ncbi:hypothetical protein [Fodinicola feengrottensis]|uniref:Uncharacterized protein n=1 Tax=Fodinicola feengrottensis TaxID=435914 RepID=A0ABP4UCW4_9ACTN|nr:hypothetical protein [Fodinicola feengrottensis]
MSTIDGECWTVYMNGTTHVFGSWHLAQKTIKALAKRNPNQRIMVKAGQP